MDVKKVVLGGNGKKPIWNTTFGAVVILSSCCCLSALCSGGDDEPEVEHVAPSAAEPPEHAAPVEKSDDEIIAALMPSLDKAIQNNDRAEIDSVLKRLRRGRENRKDIQEAKVRVAEYYIAAIVDVVDEDRAKATELRASLQGVGAPVGSLSEGAQAAYTKLDATFLESDIRTAIDNYDVTRAEELAAKFPDDIPKEIQRDLDGLQEIEKKIGEVQQFVDAGDLKKADKQLGSLEKTAPGHPRLAEIRGALDQKLGAVEAEKKRLGQRKFVSVSPKALYNTLLRASNWEETWDTKYADRFVKWSAKFYSKDMGVLNQFTLHAAGRDVVVKCATLDSSLTRDALDAYQKWDQVKVEGKLTAITKIPGEMHATVTLAECRLP